MTTSNEPSPRHGSKSKRRRIAVACESCRSRKTRCNGIRPVCGTCLDMDFECVYSAPSKTSARARYNQPETQTHLESRLKEMEDMLQALASKAGIEHQSMAYNTSAASQQEETAFVSHGLNGIRNAPEPERHTLNPNPRLTSTNTMVVTRPDAQQNDTVDGMVLITFANESTSAYFGPSSNSAFFSHIDANLRRTRSAHVLPQEGNVNLNFNNNFVSRPPSPGPTQRSRKTASMNLDQVNSCLLPPRATMFRYIDDFFSGFGMMFPYLHREAIQAELEVSSLSQVRRSWLCLINVMMAFATSAPMSTEQQKSDAEIYLQRALNLLPDIVMQPTNLETVQGLLLLVQYLQGTQHSARTWTVHGLGVHAAFQIGLHSPAELAKHSALEQEIRKRAWHTCCILDKTCSMTFGRPPTISDSLSTIPPPENMELEEMTLTNVSCLTPTASNSKSYSVSAFIQSVKLYAVMGHILDKVYDNNIHAVDDTSPSIVFNRVMSVDPELARWKSELPWPLHILSVEEAQIAITDPDRSGDTAFNFILTLRYFHARLLLHRPILVCFLGYDSSSNSSEEEWTFLLQFGRSSLQMCLNSALEMINILSLISECKDKLRPATTWWFQIYYAFSSALVIFAVIVINHRHGADISTQGSARLLSTIQNTMHILGRLEPDSRIGSRCRKYLKKMHSLSQFLIYNTGNATTADPITDGVGITDQIEQPGLDISNISPSEFDSVQFMAEADWGNFLQPCIDESSYWLGQ